MSVSIASILGDVSNILNPLFNPHTKVAPQGLDTLTVGILGGIFTCALWVLYTIC